MLDQLIIGDIASYDDFEASVRERTIHAPKKKSIKETIPFSNKTYDFSAINGEVYWEERTLEYVFEITADTPEELEEKKQGFVGWVMNIQEEHLHDPFILDYHFVATFDDIDIDDSEIEKSTISVTFTAYPYMVANYKQTHSLEISTTAATLVVHNGSCHGVVPTVSCTAPFTVTMGVTTISFPAGTATTGDFTLAAGANELSVKTTSGSGTLTIEFYEEVF